MALGFKHKEPWPVALFIPCVPLANRLRQKLASYIRQEEHDKKLDQPKMFGEDPLSTDG
jgi:hypothetical protein